MKMKLCIIGCQGHYHSAVEAARLNPDKYRVSGISPGFPGEDLAPLKRELEQNGATFEYIDDYFSMLQNTKPDVAVVNSRFDKNAAITLEAMQNGVHVFCEKPLSISLNSFLCLEEAVRTSGIKVSSMLTARYDPWFFAAYDTILKGGIGDVRLIHAQKSYKLGKRPDYYSNRDTYGGTLLWVGIHAIDWIRWLSGGEFKSVSALHSRKDNLGYGELEITAAAQYTMTNDVIASLTCDYYRPSAAETHGDDRVRVIGTKGVVEVCGEKVFLLNEKGCVELPQMDKVNIFEDFINYLRGDPTTRLTMEDSFAATRAALKTLESADKKTIVDF